MFAQLVDDATGLVLGNQITPIEVTLDGKAHTTTVPLEMVAFTAKPGAKLTLQLVATTAAYAQPRLGGNVDFDSVQGRAADRHRRHAEQHVIARSGRRREPISSCGSRRTARRAPERVGEALLARRADELAHRLGVRAERAQLGAGADAGAQAHRVHLAVHDALVELQQLDRHQRDAARDLEHALVELVGRERARWPSRARPPRCPMIESPVSIISIALRIPRNHGWKCMSGTPKRTAG